jgi:serine/threonine protein kinase
MVTGRLADFQLGRRLGAGSFGEVYEAFDRQRQMRVALKRLLITHPEALYRFKKEFRSLAGIFHPNLVALHELFTEGEGWYIAMELVHGVDIVRYARRDALVAFAATDETTLEDELSSTVNEGIPSGVDDERLRAALLQLAQGVEALHDAGRVHRDLKPSNVLVNAEGVVKVLDFGLIAELTGHAGASFLAVGTPEYMAPEQVVGGEIAPAADWYAVGSLLYEALTSRAPFEGEVQEILAAKQTADAEDPRALRPGLPDDLCDLCMRLLQRDPAQRPNGRELVERVDARRLSSPRPPRNSTPPVLVGRDAQLRQLAEAYEECRNGATSIVHVSGPSGIGKSTLLTTFLSRPEAFGSAVILQGRCYEGDAVPFKAVDTIVDALTARLLRARPEETAQILPKDFDALTRLFPALRRVDSRPHGGSLGLKTEAPFEIRRRGFSAMREMLGRLGALHPLVIWIDDLQWGDGDSVTFLQDLIHPPDAPSLLLVLSYRSEEEEKANEVVRALQQRVSGADHVRRIRLAPLDPRDAATLATALLSTTGTPAEADVEAIVRESRGDPLFVHELSRHVMSGRSSDDVTVDDLITDRVMRLDETGRSVLAVVALAATALDVAVLREVVGLSGEVLLAVIGALKAEHLVRVRRVGEGEAIEAQHDRIRERARALLEPTVARAWHKRLADELEKLPGADPEALALHHRAAGNLERAVWHVEHAAADALRALAFERAARLYKVALGFEGHPPEKRRVLHEQFGTALANSGRGVQAAREFEIASVGAPSDESFDLRRRAADQLLRSGHFDRGVEASRVVLAAIGLRIPITHRFGTLASLLFYRTLVLVRGLRFRERPRDQIQPAERRRIDAWWSVGSSLASIDPVLGYVFSTRALLLALSAGDLERTVRSVAWEVGFIALRGGTPTRYREELAEYAHALAARSGTLHARIFATIGTGSAMVFCGRFREAAAQLEVAHRLLDDGSTGLVHERVTARQFLIAALAALGRWKELLRLQQEGLRDARARGDVYASVTLRTGWSNLVWLMDDRPDLADAEARGAIDQWSKSGFHVMHFYGLMARIRALLYVENGAGAHALATELIRETRRSLLWRVQILRIYSWHLRAASALAMVANGFGDREALLHQAAQDASALGREGIPWSRAIAALVRAGVAVQRGAADAVDAIGGAVTELAAVDLHGYAAAGRDRLARLKGEGSASAEMTEATEFFRGEGVVNPEKMINMLAPGLLSRARVSVPEA